jgi:hypothetical protein
MGAQNLIVSQLQTFALQLASKLEANSSLVKETIALVGIDCRLPGTKGTNAFWHLLRDPIW